MPCCGFLTTPITDQTVLACAMLTVAIVTHDGTHSRRISLI